jgi:hypothetical protein
MFQPLMLLDIEFISHVIVTKFSNVVVCTWPNAKRTRSYLTKKRRREFERVQMLEFSELLVT